MVMVPDKVVDDLIDYLDGVYGDCDITRLRLIGALGYAKRGNPKVEEKAEGANLPGGAG